MRSVDPRYLEIVALVRRARRRRRVTQTELARRVGRPQSWVAKLEAGRRRIDIVELLLVCEALTITFRDVCPQSLYELVYSEASTRRVVS